jgi:hypothetical protein
MNASLPMSVARTLPVVTYVTTDGGVGTGYLDKDGTVYASGGNGYAYEKPNVKTVRRDGGKGYMAAVRQLLGPPGLHPNVVTSAYKASAARKN